VPPAPWLAPLLLQGVGSDVIDGDAVDVNEDRQDSAEGTGGPDPCFQSWLVQVNSFPISCQIIFFVFLPLDFYSSCLHA
jgi:hypothetical protein